MRAGRDVIFGVDFDELAAKDLAEVKLRERLGRQAFLAQKAQHAAVVDQQRSAQSLKEAKTSAKVAEKARKKLLEKRTVEW